MFNVHAKSVFVGCMSGSLLKVGHPIQDTYCVNVVCDMVYEIATRTKMSYSVT